MFSNIAETGASESSTKDCTHTNSLSAVFAVWSQSFHYVVHPGGSGGIHFGKLIKARRALPKFIGHALRARDGEQVMCLLRDLHRSQLPLTPSSSSKKFNIAEQSAFSSESLSAHSLECPSPELCWDCSWDRKRRGLLLLNRLNVLQHLSLPSPFF